MKVVLLCAGYATRLYPLTENQPKPLLPVNEKPIAEYILDKLKELEEVTGVIVVTNHKFASHFTKWAEGLNYPWPVEVVDDQTTSNDDRLGAIGDLQYALNQKGVQSEDVMVIAGDNLFDFDLSAFVNFADEKRPSAVIAVYDVKDIVLAKQYGLVKKDDTDRVLEFFEKPENPTTTLASCGLYMLPKEIRGLLDRYLEEGHNADQPGHYMRWLAENEGVFASALEGRWFDIGDLKSYQHADEIFRRENAT